MIKWTDKKESDTDYWNGIVNNKGEIELRKSFSKNPNYAQVLIVIDDDRNVTMSMNGKASMSVLDALEISSVVAEATQAGAGL